MNRVVEQRHRLEAPVKQPHQRANSHIVDSRFLRTIKPMQPPEILALRPRRMLLGIGLLMVGFLKNLVGSNARRLHQLEPFVVERRGIDVHAADLAVAMLLGIDHLHGVVNKLRVVLRMLAIDHNQPLMPPVHQRLNLLFQLRHRKRLARYRFVRATEPAILAVVDALVADIKRCKQHNTVAINLFLQRPRPLENLLRHLRRIGIDQRGHLLRLQPVLVQRPRNNFPHPLLSWILRFFQPLENFVFGNKAFQPFNIHLG